MGGMRVPHSNDTTGRDRAALRDAFHARFGAVPRLFQAPGRINIIGEHTDYSEGLVLPAAIDRFCTIAIAPNAHGTLRLVSLTLGEEQEISTVRLTRRGDWSDYVAGVFFVLRAAGTAAPACDVMVASDVPMGAGVSSSAALEVAAAHAFAAMAGSALPADAASRIARAAEQDFVGMPCGPMDQYIAAHGRDGTALLLDCRSMIARETPIPEDASFLVIDSGVRHKLIDGGYKARRADCEEAARRLGVAALRDADLARIAGADLPPRLFKRARHVVTENVRCEDAARALMQGDLTRVGQLMAQSHASLRDDFEVTCAETDSLAALANSEPGVFGARQMGGGFGGAVLALVESRRVAAVRDALVAAYEAERGARAEAFICRVAGGAGEVAA